MKESILKNLIIITVVMIMITGCGKTAKTKETVKNEETECETEETKKIKTAADIKNETAVYEYEGMNLADYVKNQIAMMEDRITYVTWWPWRHSEKEEEKHVIFPKDLEEYLKQALIDDRVEECLDEIKAEYHKVEEEEKETLINGKSIRYYAPLFDENDTWYLADLSEWKNDLVICRDVEGGYKLTYIFINGENCGYEEVPYMGGGQRNSEPYFINWEGKNYIVFPFWDKEEKRIVGVTVYDYDRCRNVLSIGMDSNWNMNVIKQACHVGVTNNEERVEAGDFDEYVYDIPKIEAYKVKTAADREDDTTICEYEGMNLADYAASEIHNGGYRTAYVMWNDEKGEEENYVIFPKDLEEYLKQALTDDRLEECLDNIKAEYHKVKEEEKKKLMVGELGILYYAPLFDENDTWYQADLSEWKNDLVICRDVEEGYKLTYIFINEGNCGYGEPPYMGGGQRNSEPHFINWEGTNYIVFPFWDKEEKRIVGVTVYDYSNYRNVMSIGMNSDGTMNVIKQGCWALVENEWQFIEDGSIDDYIRDIPKIEAY